MLLDVRGVSVSFGGVSALTDVDLTVDAGSVTGLIGPNGAGKTTLFNVVSGLQVPDAGVVALDGEEMTSLKPYQRARLGVGRTFQRLEVFGSMSVRDNIRVSAEILKAWNGDASDPASVADNVIDRIGLRDVAATRADELPTGMARLVELGRALAIEPRLLLLDEPSSGLDEQETAQLSSLLRALAREGLGVLLVEHDVEFVMGVCKRIHVLDFGRILAVGTAREIQRSAAVQEAYLGASRKSRR
ncbi:MAG TPA: ABC transporter ATP-binding protein [Actinomycetota bacterium]|jgi:branched-chain amino acid transport system ATP-binding protein|nr:ABC transporter ATP-binding protein [Actinomycetota bacterium]